MELQETRITKSRLPIWVWWVIGLALIAAISVGVIFLVRKKTLQIPPGLVERREAVSRILDDINKIEDVDIKPLVELESKKDYKGAVALMDQALSKNGAYEYLNSSLVSVSEELTKLSLQIKPDDVGTKAIEAFGLLARLAQAEKNFYERRRTLYEITKSYYGDLVAKRNPPIPVNLRELVVAVNEDLKKAKELQNQFAAAVKAFDDAASVK